MTRRAYNLDPVVGAYLSAYYGDGVHYNQTGAQAAGNVIAAVVNRIFQDRIPLVATNAVIAGSLQTKPLALGTPVSGTDFGSLSGLGTSTIASAADADFVGGSCYKFTVGDTGINGRMANVTLIAGHKYRFGLALKAVGAGTWGMRWESNTTGAKILYGMGYGASFNIQQPISRFFAEFVAPASLPDFGYRLRIAVTGSAGFYLELGEITMIDLGLE